MAQERTHEQVLAEEQQRHLHEIAEAKNVSLLRAKLIQQSARIGLIFSIVATWLFQTGYVTIKAVNHPEILTDVEKFTALILITGGLVAVLVMKLWPENE
ncbi:hypothetical protein LCGC14_2040930 [marine sediment metagenome]|uniref:Uncharacterized protein n=1 Tax=marine sediment metagenome TaxID=412755 RepID=A0A0F9FEI7_9ZZZZ